MNRAAATREGDGTGSAPAGDAGEMKRTGRLVLVAMTAIAVVGALAGLWVAVVGREDVPSGVSSSGEQGSPPEDLSSLESIDLDGLEGATLNLGSSRSRLLPAVATGGPGESRLVLIDVEGSTVVDAGTIPIDKQMVDLYPTASDQFVTMVVSVCPGGTAEEDTGQVCAVEPGSEAATTVLVVYDIADKTWATMRIVHPPNSYYGLIDTDGATATFEELAAPGRPPRWATVALDEPLELGQFTATKPDLRPNGFENSLGHMDGFGWKTQSRFNGESRATTWTGTRDGDPTSIRIAESGNRTLRGAGQCLAIATFDGDRIEHLHRLCAT